MVGEAKGYIPTDALPVRNLVSSRANASSAASICERAAGLTVAPISKAAPASPSSLSSS